MRFWSLGLDEAQFWDRCLLGIPDTAWLPDNDGRCAASEEQGQAMGRRGVGNTALRWWGMPAEICADAINPGALAPAGAARKGVILVRISVSSVQYIAHCSAFH